MRRRIYTILMMVALLPTVGALAWHSPTVKGQENKPPHCKAEFAATTVCKGQPTVFTNLSSGMGTFNWSFGDGQNFSGPTPTHVYANAGTYTVTLTMTPTGCSVQHQVTVLQAPTALLISGPTTMCDPGKYTIPPQPQGCVIAWSVTGGMIQNGQGTPGIDVIWNPNGNGLVAVTVTCKNCCKGSTQISVLACAKIACCKDVNIDVSMPQPGHNDCWQYTLNPTLAVTGTGLGPITQVTASLVSTSVTYSSVPSCGKNGPALSYFLSASSPNGFSTSFVPFSNTQEVVWTSNNSSGVPPGSFVGFDFMIQFPPGPPPNCTDKLSFCIKYTFTDVNCKTCQVIRCYTYVRKHEPPPPPGQSNC